MKLLIIFILLFFNVFCEETICIVKSGLKGNYSFDDNSIWEEHNGYNCPCLNSNCKIDLRNMDCEMSISNVTGTIEEIYAPTKYCNDETNYPSISFIDICKINKLLIGHIHLFVEDSFTIAIIDVVSSENEIVGLSLHKIHPDTLIINNFNLTDVNNFIFNFLRHHHYHL